GVEALGKEQHAARVDLFGRGNRRNQAQVHGVEKQQRDQAQHDHVDHIEAEIPLDFGFARPGIRLHMPDLPYRIPLPLNFLEATLAMSSRMKFTTELNMPIAEE